MNAEDQALALAVVRRLCPRAEHMSDAELDADPICQWVECLFRKVRDEAVPRTAEAKRAESLNTSVTDEAARMAVRFARFEAFGEAIEACDEVQQSRVPMNVEILEARKRIEELRSAAKPRAAKLKPGETCAACGHHEMTRAELDAEVERLRDKAERVRQSVLRRESASTTSQTILNTLKGSGDERSGLDEVRAVAGVRSVPSDGRGGGPEDVVADRVHTVQVGSRERDQERAELPEAGDEVGRGRGLSAADEAGPAVLCPCGAFAKQTFGGFCSESCRDDVERMAIDFLSDFTMVYTERGESGYDLGVSAITALIQRVRREEEGRREELRELLRLANQKLAVRT